MFQIRTARYVLPLCLLLSACGGNTEKQAAKEPTATTEAASASGPTSSFSPEIDKHIEQASAGNVPDLNELYYRVVAESGVNPDDIPFGTWTPWLTDFSALSWFTFDPATDKAEDQAYSKPVPLPNAAGRQLYLAGYQPIVLLEFKGDKYRFVRLGEHNEFGGITHKLYQHPDASLLVLENLDGNMGAGRGASGQAITSLQVYDMLHDKWLLNTRVGIYDVHMGYEDEAGENQEGGEQQISRYFKVLDKGRTVVLGNYTIEDGEDPVDDKLSDYTLVEMPPRLFGETDTDSTDLPAGTYRLAGGQYKRAAR